VKHLPQPGGKGQLLTVHPEQPRPTRRENTGNLAHVDDMADLKIIYGLDSAAAKAERLKVC
jgi:hypothetical protein